METFKIKENHVYLGGSDMVLEWAGYQSDDEGASENTELLREKLVTQVREKIKNYLQLDHVSFLFGTGSSIHLGAAGIQNIPKQIENDILASSSVFKEDFKKYVINLQKSLKDTLPEVFNYDCLKLLYTEEDMERIMNDLHIQFCKRLLF